MTNCNISVNSTIKQLNTLSEGRKMFEVTRKMFSTASNHNSGANPVKKHNFSGQQTS
jgi:hypothetical protein